MNKKPSLQTIYSTFYFRRPTGDDFDHIWSTTWYRLDLEESHLETEEEALAKAEAAWEEEEFSLPFLVRHEKLPDFWGRLIPGWSIYYLDLLPVSDLPLVEEGRIEVYMKQLDDTPFSYRKDATDTARYRWKRDRGQTPIAVVTEMLEKTEVVRRRLARSQKLAVHR